MLRIAYAGFGPDLFRHRPIYVSVYFCPTASRLDPPMSACSCKIIGGEDGLKAVDGSFRFVDPPVYDSSVRASVKTVLPERFLPSFVFAVGEAPSRLRSGSGGSI